MRVIPVCTAAAGLLLALAASSARPDSLRVTRAAALGPGGFGLEVRLDDPRRQPAEDAWVAVGEDRGLRAERSLQGRVRLDPGGVAVAPAVKAARLGFLTLARGAADAAGVVQLSLEREAAGWQVVPRAWDDTRGTLVPLGRAALALDDVQGGVALEFEWRAASAPGVRDGSFTLARRAPAGGPAVLLLRRDDLDNAAQAIGQVRLGVAAREHSPGVAGVLRLDEFELYRAVLPEPPRQ